ncbi:MAG TPA: cation:proton antiporter [Pedococcus sp.]|nr:cation:proton antiporter [Pedococcus sp.]
MSADLVFLVGGVSLLLAVVLPSVLQRAALSAPLVLIGVGALIGLLPMTQTAPFDPLEHRELIEHVAEVTVLIALMGVGLALDRPLSLRDRAGWGRWAATWKLLGIAMPLTIAGVAVLGWWGLGIAPAAALLLGAALSPTDPVLASDVQVAGPNVDEAAEEVDEEDEVRFALTSEAGLNDGLAFPFVYAAVFLASKGAVSGWGLQWVAWELVGKSVIGVAVGVATGWLLGRIAFRSRAQSLRVAETGEPLMALAAVLLAYGASEVSGGYGFLAVFACAMTIRSAERSHDYHALMHQVIERLERLLTLLVLLFVGLGLTHGLLAHLDWRGLVVAGALVFVIRPLAGFLALSVGRRGLARGGGSRLERRERLVTAFFGVRGIGSIYYLAYALGLASFPEERWLWSTVAFTIVLSVVVHGMAVTPVMRGLEREREAAGAA